MNNNQKTSILIVEDDNSIAELVKDLLNDELNFHAIVVNNGAIAIELLKELKINLLILDIGLPGITGLQIYDWLLNHQKLSQMSVMFMTAQTAQYQKELDRRGITNVVHKPFDLDEFLEVVRRALISDQPKAIETSMRQREAGKLKVSLLDNSSNISRNRLNKA